ncbi:hypothetical protein LEP1GSC170_5951 [Leptospira interrogans serovar Bataviae str. HAI135]|nr:hypothetical protein LEP1GSC170_5951 [Leptospira interrogans serovar Bataviae str. HAI135]
MRPQNKQILLKTILRQKKFFSLKKNQDDSPNKQITKSKKDSDFSDSKKNQILRLTKKIRRLKRK